MDNKTLGYRLRRIREASGLSQAQVAEALGLKSGSAIAKIEAGNRRITATEFAAWAGACGTTADAVLNGEPFVVHFGEAAS